MKRIGKAGIKIFNLPIKFYSNTESSGSSGTTTANKKYEITITQPPEHEPSPDFIRGIPYAAKDNVMFCKYREMTLEDMKEMNPNATTVPSNYKILQDINGKDIIITSDEIEKFINIPVYIYDENMILKRVIPIFVTTKRIVEGISFASITYSSRDSSNNVYIFKISDVDAYIMVG